MICTFCGCEAAPTNEHVYPKWIREGLRATGRTVITRTKSGERHRHVTTGLTVILRRSVCQACNTGWMSTYFENVVKDWLLPAMWGNPTGFTPGMQRRVAAWACKMALMFELKAAEDRRQLAYAPASNLHWLYEHRTNPEPPPGCQVWIAALQADLLTADALTGWHTVTTSKPPQDMEFYAVTFSAGDLVFQVSGQDFREPDLNTPTGLPLARLEKPDWFLSYVNTIWPARADTIDWPRSSRLKRSDLPRFADWEGTSSRRERLVRLPRLEG
jgi:hypothetical protein